MFGTKNIHAHVSLLCMLAYTTFDLKNLLLKGQCTQNLKKKSLSSCTHSAEHKWSSWTPLTSIRFLWKSMDPQNLINHNLITNILQNIFLYVQHKKETNTGLEEH